MRKKILSVILAAVMSMTLLTGCSLFSYDNERDSMQVVATIKSVTITDGSGASAKKFETEEKKLYKYDLVAAVNSTGATLINSYGYSVEDAVEYLLDQLVTRELVLNEADAQISFGNITFGQREKNEVKRNIYTSIDSQLASIRNDILSERGGETAEIDSSAYLDEDATPETTYPTPEDEEPGLYDGMAHDELVGLVLDRTEISEDRVSAYSDTKLRAVLEDLDEQDVDPWEPDKLRYPGLYGDEEVRSLELQAMRRLLTMIRDVIADDFRVPAADKKTYSDELDGFDKVANEKGVSAVYPLLGDSKVMMHLLGDDYTEQVKISLLQKYITDSVDVTEADVLKAYGDKLSEQKAQYGADVQSFYDAVSASSDRDTILYYPNGNYYFVKHILIPFSDAQTAELTAYKASAESNILGDDAVAQKKANLGKNVTGFEHRNGEDYGKPISIRDIVADVVRTIQAAGGNVKDSARAFDSLIYKYNTDPGIFGNELGYAVKAAPLFGEGETYDTQYMQEFSEAAEKLYRRAAEKGVSELAGTDALVGADYDDLVVTDYGVHILYLSRVIPAEGMTVGINDFISGGQHATVYGELEDDLRSSRVDAFFQRWQQQKVGYYLVTANIVEKNDKAYNSVIKDISSD